jgi:hypothetical protein
MEATSANSLRSRRALIAAGLGGVAATAAHAVGRPLPAQAGHGPGIDPNALHLGAQNSTDAETRLSADLPEGTPPGPIALQVGINKGRAVNGFASVGVGVWGVSLNGDQDQPHVGVEGSSENNGIGVRGQSKGENGTPGGSGPGVEGESSTGPGVHGFSEFEGGVEGNSDFGDGVRGFGSHDGGTGVRGDGSVGVAGTGTVFGVHGFSDSGVAGQFYSNGDAGVRAFAPGDFPAVSAISGIEAEGGEDGGLALDVVGKARFSTAGAAAVAAGQNTAVVANTAVTGSSHVSVTLVGDPGPRQLRWLQRSPGVGFTVHFSGGPPGQRPQVPFTYLIVEPA